MNFVFLGKEVLPVQELFQEQFWNGDKFHAWFSPKYKQRVRFVIVPHLFWFCEQKIELFFHTGYEMFLEPSESLFQNSIAKEWNRDLFPKERKQREQKMRNQNKRTNGKVDTGSRAHFHGAASIQFTVGVLYWFPLSFCSRTGSRIICPCRALSLMRVTVSHEFLFPVHYYFVPIVCC